MAKVDPKALVTNEDLNSAVDTILKGMDNMLEEQKKTLATKDDLNREVSWLRGDIKGLTADISGVPSKKEFNQLKEKVDKYLAS